MPETRRWLRFLPDTIASGIFTLLIGVVILMAASTLLYLFVTRNDAGNIAAASQAADQIIAINRMLQNDPPEDRLRLIRRLSSPTMRMVITPMALVEESDTTWTSRMVMGRLERELPDGTEIRVDSRATSRLPADAHVDMTEPPRTSLPPTTRPPDGAPDDGQSGREGRGSREELSPEQRQLRLFMRMQDDESPRVYPDQGNLRVSIKFDQNAWLNARVLLNLGTVPTRRRPIIFLSFMSLLVGVGALVAVTRAFRPLRVFADAAERLGVDVNAPPLDDAGPREVRGAAKAFNRMQERLQRFIQDRTQMLAAISHDLRTPITRLRLRAEFVDDDEQREKMLKDLEEMETMIAATLSFARDDASHETISPVDLAALLNAIRKDAQAAGHDVTYTGPQHLSAQLRPVAVKRAMNNLVDNAVKYGTRARISLAQNADTIEILIDDDGPGIPANERERVFQPFVRLETSRSRETGGTGLGMTIARNIVRGMGGDVEIMDRPDPGLRLRVTLPVSGL